MFDGSRSERPQELAVRCLDWHIIDAGVAAHHQALGVEFPVLIAIAAKPLAGVIMPFVGKSHRDAWPVAGPQFFDQAVIEFLGPLAQQKLSHLLASNWKLGAIA